MSRGAYLDTAVFVKGYIWSTTLRKCSGARNSSRRSILATWEVAALTFFTLLPR
ncbi:MAG: hypothetical protein RIS92_2347 [Verrucomicrobiota bacterium]